MQELFENWKKQYSDITKLHWVYVLTGVVLVVLAGLTGLLNQEVSRAIVNVAGGIFLVLLVNIVTWSLVAQLLTPKRGTSTRKK